MSWRRLLVLVVLSLLSPSPVSSLEFRHAYSGGNCTGCEWIVAEGEVQIDDDLAFREFVRREAIQPFPAHNVIQFNSQGGVLIGAVKLGEAIRELGFSTSVGASSNADAFGESLELGTCVSACAIAFLGGKIRYVSDDHSLGFHQFYEDAALATPEALQFSGLDRSVDQIITGIVVEYVVNMGVDPRLYRLIADTPPDSIRWLTMQEARELQVDNGREWYSQWMLIPFAKGVVSEVKSDRGKIVRAYCRESEVLLTYLIPGSRLAFENMKDALLSREPGLRLTVSNHQVVPKAVGVELLEGDKFAVILQLSHDEIAAILGAGVVTPNTTDFAHVFWDTIEDLSLDARGDPRLVALTLKNCI